MFNACPMPNCYLIKSVDCTVLGKMCVTISLVKLTRGALRGGMGAIVPHPGLVKSLVFSWFWAPTGAEFPPGQKKIQAPLDKFLNTPLQLTYIVFTFKKMNKK